MALGNVLHVFEVLCHVVAELPGELPDIERRQDQPRDQQAPPHVPRPEPPPFGGRGRTARPIRPAEGDREDREQPRRHAASPLRHRGVGERGRGLCLVRHCNCAAPSSPLLDHEPVGTGVNGQLLAISEQTGRRIIIQDGDLQKMVTRAERLGESHVARLLPSIEIVGSDIDRYLVERHDTAAKRTDRQLRSAHRLRYV